VKSEIQAIFLKAHLGKLNVFPLYQDNRLANPGVIYQAPPQMRGSTATTGAFAGFDSREYGIHCPRGAWNQSPVHEQLLQHPSKHLSVCRTTNVFPHMSASSGSIDVDVEIPNGPEVPPQHGQFLQAVQESSNDYSLTAM